MEEEVSTEDVSWFGQHQKQSLVVLLLLVAGIWFSTSREQEPAKVQIEAAVRAMVAASESKSIGPFKEHLHPGFKDKHGRTKDAILNFVRGIFLRHRNISATIFSLNIDSSLDSDDMVATMTLLISDSPIPQDRATFVLTFRKLDGKWLCYRADWDAASEEAW